MTTLAACASCGEALVDGARFCEACGAATDGPPAQPAERGAPASGGGCERCGGEIDADRYCTSCGHRAAEAIAVDDRGPVASATHRGRRHHRNEDAVALAATAEGWPVLIVSDGVSISPNPHRASAAAVAAAADRLAGRPFAGTDDLVAAVAAAQASAAAVPADGDPHWTPDGTAPACTIVVAVASAGAVHVANVGDARAHLLEPDGRGWRASQLSTDDSVAAEAVAQGIDAEIALSLPGGHGITAWLGADAPGPDPHVATHPGASGTMLLACSDGLWNYAPADEAVAQLVGSITAPPDGRDLPAAQLCERLVAWAIHQGGADNITVAVAPVPAEGSADGAPTHQEEDE